LDRQNLFSDSVGFWRGFLPFGNRVMGRLDRYKYRSKELDWGLLGDYWGLLGDYWGLLGDYWGLLGDYWGLLGDYWGLLVKFRNLRNFENFVISLSHSICLSVSFKTSNNPYPTT
jgi:hypothetical protein